MQKGLLTFQTINFYQVGNIEYPSKKDDKRLNISHIVKS